MIHTEYSISPWYIQHSTDRCIYVKPQSMIWHAYTIPVHDSVSIPSARTWNPKETEVHETYRISPWCIQHLSASSIWRLLRSLWKEAQREVRQHLFITVYIAAYIQGLYKITRVHPTGLTVNQGCRQVSTRSFITIMSATSNHHPNFRRQRAKKIAATFVVCKMLFWAWNSPNSF